MKFPSPEFDDAVAALCHGTATETQRGNLTEILLADAEARDEYLLRVEVHARLASDPGLFMASSLAEAKVVALPVARGRWLKYAAAATALAACLVALAFFIGQRPRTPDGNPGPTVAETRATQAPAAPAAESTDALTFNLRLESLRARLAASEDRLRRLEMAQGTQEVPRP